MPARSAPDTTCAPGPPREPDQARRRSGSGSHRRGLRGGQGFSDLHSRSACYGPTPHEPPTLGAARARRRAEQRRFRPPAGRAQAAAPDAARAVLVSRAPLVARLQRTSAEIAVVTAPAGYGKTTLLAELVASEPRPSVWLYARLVRQRLGRAAHLGRLLVLDQIEPIHPAAVSARPAVGPVASLRSRATSPTPALPRFGRMLEHFSTPFVLVLDDVHTIVTAEALDVLAMLVASQPAGCLLVLAGRAAPPLKLGRLRVKRGWWRSDAATLPSDPTRPSPSTASSVWTSPTSWRAGSSRAPRAGRRRSTWRRWPGWRTVPMQERTVP